MGGVFISSCLSREKQLPKVYVTKKGWAEYLLIWRGIQIPNHGLLENDIFILSDSFLFEIVY